ncbi:antitermination regulator [Rhodococcus oxybenzonivorans]|uniref:Antitermination regulator n=1 Tax=Rhodococcus oxybenzonivorans TaxID=1990687 RepID=A0A2S2BTZ9_9NOCA|nr:MULTISPECIES: GAF and ANTAR domain-containing protein [Rhodococcus]AWK72097.1 antitermination regulator [Rhodococcus oxybenzonivorans]QTJ64869.1 GAF and ANTAR domain-containing protein [Rhodococcus sp. ZPP]
MRDDEQEATRSQPVDKASASLTGLAELVYAGADFRDVQQAVCDVAPILVDGCSHASLMLHEKGRFVTAAANDTVAARVDELERSENEGPCVDAIVEETPQLVPDLAAAHEWPRLVRRVLAETPVRGAAGFRLVVRRRKVGALNLFADTPGALTAASVEQGIMLASFAAVALTAAHEHLEAETLRAGLTSNREIGKALGLMMAFHNITEDQALAILQATSQEMNIKISALAEEIIVHHHKTLS